jgi:putative transposase
VRYACIERHREEFEVTLTCRVLEVTRSGFYAWRVREPSARARKEERLQVEVGAIYRMSRGRYGSPRVHAGRPHRASAVALSLSMNDGRRDPERSRDDRRWDRSDAAARSARPR